MSGKGEQQDLAYLHFDAGWTEDDLLFSSDGGFKSVELGSRPGEK